MLSPRIFQPYEFKGFRAMEVTEPLRAIPKWFFGQVVFGGLGCQGRKTTPFQENNGCWPCRRRRQGQTTTYFWKMCGFLASVPQASKNHLAKKQRRDPLSKSKLSTPGNPPLPSLGSGRPPGPEGLPTPRGRPDLQNRRFPAGPQIQKN